MLDGRPTPLSLPLTGAVSTLLTKLSKSSEVVKAERGYRFP